MQDRVVVKFLQSGRSERVLKFPSSSFEWEAIRRIVGDTRPVTEDDFPIQDEACPIGFTVRQLMKPDMVNFEVPVLCGIGPITSLSTGPRTSTSSFLTSPIVLLDHFLYNLRRDVYFCVGDLKEVVAKMKSRTITMRPFVEVMKMSSIAPMLSSVALERDFIERKWVGGYFVRDCYFKK